MLVAPRVLGDVENGEDEVVGESDGVTRRGRNRASSYPNRRPSAPRGILTSASIRIPHIARGLTLWTVREKNDIAAEYRIVQRVS